VQNTPNLPSRLCRLYLARIVLRTSFEVKRSFPQLFHIFSTEVLGLQADPDAHHILMSEINIGVVVGFPEPPRPVGVELAGNRSVGAYLECWNKQQSFSLEVVLGPYSRLTDTVVVSFRARAGSL
jgi:hypothetical protein